MSNNAIVADPAPGASVSTDRPVPVWRSAAGRVVGAVWLWPALLMGLLGFRHLGRAEMWQDELVTIDVANRSTRHILTLLNSVDAVHGAYYLFTHGWVRAFGDSATAIRTPSALAMTGAAACVAVVGQQLFDKRTGILAGLLFAVVPSMTRFAQEARSYAFVVFAAALATVLLLRAMDRPGAWRWIGYGLCLSAVAFLNAVAFTVVAGHAVAVAILCRRQHRWRPLVGFVAATVAALIAASPVIYLGTQQAGTQVLWITHTAVWTVWPQTFSSAGVAWAVVVLAGLAWVSRRPSTVVITAIAVVPLPVIWLASLGSLSYFFSKYLLFVIPAWAVIAAAGLATIRLRWVSVAGLLTVAVLAVPGQKAMRDPLSHSWYEYPQPRALVPLAYAQAAQVVADGYHPGDGIIYQRVPLYWLLLDVGVPYYFPDTVKPRDVFLYRSAASLDSLEATECPQPSSCLGTEPRIWVILAGRTDQAMASLTPGEIQAMSPHYTQVSVAFRSGLTIALFQRIN